MIRRHPHLVGYLIVVVASIGASVGYTRSIEHDLRAQQENVGANTERIRMAAIISCERGNILRANQRLVVTSILAIATALEDRASVGLQPVAGDVIPSLVGVFNSIPPVDCQRSEGGSP